MEEFYRRVLSGRARGPIAAMLRSATRIVEPIYRGIVASRNSSYSRGILKTSRINRPVISVGNITTGGTGKTPVVAWLANNLRAREFRVAILMRGYKSSATTGSDEQALLKNLLNADASPPPIVVHANPDRVAGANEVLREHPEIDVFILDDGFQHRRLHRDFDLVLIDATNPFGYDHVLPRGLLRESLGNLSRASAFLITRVDQALRDELLEIEKCLNRNAHGKPVYRCKHLHRRLLDAHGSSRDVKGQPTLAFCAIGNPEAFEQQLAAAGMNVVAHRRFADHYRYRESDVASLHAQAKSSGASSMITTEKDWVKLAPLAQSADFSIPILRVELDIQFLGDDERKLLDHLLSVVAGSRSSRGL